MTRLVVTSDTHLGITSHWRVQRLVDEIRAEKPDIVAIAGDIGEGIDNIVAAMDMFSKLELPLAVVAGNHDVWNFDKMHPSKEIWERALPEIIQNRGGVWLETGSLMYGSIAVVGSIAWYDYSAQDPAFKASAEECWRRKGEFDADAWQVDWPWDDIEFSRLIEPAFRERLQAAQDDPSVREIVVITHSPIFEAQMCRKPEDEAWAFSNAYFGNLTMGEMVAQFSKVSHAVAGHTHVARDALIDLKGRPARAITLGSQYRDPVYVVLNLPAEMHAHR